MGHGQRKLSGRRMLPDLSAYNEKSALSATAVPACTSNAIVNKTAGNKTATGSFRYRYVYMFAFPIKHFILFASDGILRVRLSGTKNRIILREYKVILRGCLVTAVAICRWFQVRSLFYGFVVLVSEAEVSPVAGLVGKFALAFYCRFQPDEITHEITLPACCGLAADTGHLLN